MRTAQESTTEILNESTDERTHERTTAPDTGWRVCDTEHRHERSGQSWVRGVAQIDELRICNSKPIPWTVTGVVDASQDDD